MQGFAAHAVAHQQQVQCFRPGGAGVQHGVNDHVQALRRGEGAGKYQVEPPGKPFFQRWIRLRHGVEILAVLRDDRHFRRRFPGAGAQPFLQRLAHGNQPVAPLVQAVADRLGHKTHKLVLDRKHTVQILRPQVQHIICKRNTVLFRVFDGGPAHQHRAGVEAENRVIPAGQAFQRPCRIQRPADVVQKNRLAGVALARYLPRPEHPRTLVHFLKRAVGAVSVEPFAFGIVGQTAQHVHGEAVLHKALDNIIDAEIFRPEMLGHYQYAHRYRVPVVLVFAPHHLVYNAGVALDDLDHLVRDILVGVVGHRRT